MLRRPRSARRRYIGKPLRGYDFTVMSTTVLLRSSTTIIIISSNRYLPNVSSTFLRCPRQPARCGSVIVPLVSCDSMFTRYKAESRVRISPGRSFGLLLLAAAALLVLFCIPAPRYRYTVRYNVEEPLTKSPSSFVRSPTTGGRPSHRVTFSSESLLPKFNNSVRRLFYPSLFPTRPRRRADTYTIVCYERCTLLNAYSIRCTVIEKNHRARSLFPRPSPSMTAT